MPWGLDMLMKASTSSAALPQPGKVEPSVSIDSVRLIRRCMRCFVFGAIGLLPIVGVGLALQALQLRRLVSSELQEPWVHPRIYWFWLAGIAGLCLAEWRYGLLGDFVVIITLLAAQSVYLFRLLAPVPGGAWNPGFRPLIWGVTFAYAGLSLSLWLIAILLLRIVKWSSAS